MKIISGGQTGVDRAALDAALSLGADCGGWCPEGRLSETGKIPSHYPLRELAGGGYLERTAQNVRDTDGTVIFYWQTLQGGTRATADFCAEFGKPSLLIDGDLGSSEEAANQIAEFVSGNAIEILNAAGPRASQWQSGYDFAREALRLFLHQRAAKVPPRLSFVVPAHNEEDELPQALRAIHRAAAAAQETYELIVVDDASTDATAKIARELGACVIAVDRRQIAAARNAGGRVARGDILFFIDADTQVASAHITLAMAALAEGCIGGGARVAVDRQLPFWGNVFFHVFSTLYFATGLGAGAFLFTRRESFEEIGGFDEQYFAGEEVYFSLALKNRGRFKILREPIVTSARKLRMHSPRSILAQLFFLFLGGPNALRTRDKLGLWYDGKREPRAT
jgi:putative molybdenum carrier protein/glycosyl transferase family 2